MHMLLCCTCGPRRMCASKTHWLNTNRRPCLHKLHMCLLVLISTVGQNNNLQRPLLHTQPKTLQNSIDLCHMHLYIVSFPNLSWNKTKPLYTAYSMTTHTTYVISPTLPGGWPPQLSSPSWHATGPFLWQHSGGYNGVVTIVGYLCIVFVCIFAACWSLHVLYNVESIQPFLSNHPHQNVLV